MNDITSKTIVLIAGQPKAGTTSLFDWLSQHPDVAAGKLKELRFWLDSTYPLQSPNRYDGSNFQDYYALFNNPERSTFIDASPDYMACETPLKLPKIHPNAKAIIVVRDPVDRMISSYKFFQSRGQVPQNMSFDAYVEKQIKEGVQASTPVQYRALDYCRMGHYLPLWQAAYGDNLLILAFDNLKCDPKAVFEKVLAFLNLESCADIKLNHKNVTQTSRFPLAMRAYNSVRRWIAMETMNHPRAYVLLRNIGVSIFSWMQSSKEERVEIAPSEHTRSSIIDFCRVRENS